MKNRFMKPIMIGKLLLWHFSDTIQIRNEVLSLTRPIGLPPHAAVAQKIVELFTLIASLVKRLPTMTIRNYNHTIYERPIKLWRELIFLIKI